MTTPTDEREAEARRRLLAAFEAVCPGIVDNPFLPHWPTATQQLFLGLHLRSDESRVFEALYGGAAGGGKLLDLDTPIPTPSGFVPLRDLAPGDAVLGRDGQPHVILAESEVQHAAAWRLTFDDGSDLIANDDHRWLTFDALDLSALTRKDEEWRAARRARRPSRSLGNKSPAFLASIVQRNKARAGTGGALPTGTVRTTSEIVATLRTPSGRANHAIPVAEPLDLPHRDLPLDPYLLGVWLGDGTTTAGSITTMDPEILAAFDAAGFQRGAVQAKTTGQAATHAFLGLRQQLRALGVFGNKHVPHAYLWASREQRLALLQGLMDTDGCVADDGGVEFTNTNRELAEAVSHLLRSLGHKAVVREGVAKLNGRVIGPKWRVVATCRVPVFRLPRKLERQRMSTRRTTKFRYIVDAQRVPARPMKCLRVSSPDRLFLAGEHLIPTHNSDCLLMAAAQYVDDPECSCLVLRRTYAELAKPGAIMDRAISWWVPRGVAWDGTTKTFTFPSGAKVAFGYLAHEHDHLQYQGAEFHSTLWDELTQFPRESQYRFIGLSRVRRRHGCMIPLRTLSTSNPGGPGHSWVRSRFVGDPAAGIRAEHPYVPARIEDNPHIDRAAYIAGLEGLHPTVRAQLLRGDWSAREPGDYFRREWFGPLLDPERDRWAFADCVRVRWWDLAASERPDAARTAGVLMARHRSGVYAIEHAVAFRATPGRRDDLIVQQAQTDGHHVTVGLEIEGGSGGIAQFLAIERRLREKGYRVVGARPQDGLGDNPMLQHNRSSDSAKAGRADPVASCLERGYQRRGEGPNNGSVWWGVDAGRSPSDQRDGIRLFSGPWTQAFLDEVEGFPDAATCDLVDATSGAWAWLATRGFATAPLVEARANRPASDHDIHPEERDEEEDDGRAHLLRH